MLTGLERIRQLAQNESERKLQTLMHNVNVETLEKAHREQKIGKAAGVDRETKASYGENLQENLNRLAQRMKTFSYRPQPVRRTYIPKGDGKKLRPLPVPRLIENLNRKLRGHYNYYGVTHNSKKMVDFYQYVKWQLLRTLKRRSQRDKTNWDKLNRVFERFPILLPRVCVNIWAS